MNSYICINIWTADILSAWTTWWQTGVVAIIPLHCSNICTFWTVSLFINVYRLAFAQRNLVRGNIYLCVYQWFCVFCFFVWLVYMLVYAHFVVFFSTMLSCCYTCKSIERSTFKRLCSISTVRTSLLWSIDRLHVCLSLSVLYWVTCERRMNACFMWTRCTIKR